MSLRPVYGGWANSLKLPISNSKGGHKGVPTAAQNPCFPPSPPAHQPLGWAPDCRMALRRRPAPVRARRVDVAAGVPRGPPGHPGKALHSGGLSSCDNSSLGMRLEQSRPAPKGFSCNARTSLKDEPRDSNSFFRLFLVSQMKFFPCRMRLFFVIVPDSRT